MGSVRITPPRVRGRRRAGGGPAIPVVVLAPQEEGEGEVEDQGPALLGGDGEQGAQPAAAPLPAPEPAPLLAPQRRVVRGLKGEQVMLEPWLDPEVPGAGLLVLGAPKFHSIDR